MRDIYLVDFENVASEGLSGITFLSPEDEVIIFYSNNSNRLSMKMHILIGKSVCQLNYFEVTVGGKNALDHQISTWLGYLVGTKAADRNYYIVSKDMGYKFLASFWTESAMHPSVRCIDTIRAASRLDRSRSRGARASEPQTETVPEPQAEVPVPETLTPAPELSAPEPVVLLTPAPEAPVQPEPQPEPRPEPIPEPEPAPRVAVAEIPVLEATPASAPKRRTFFGVVLPDLPETPAEPEPQPEPEAPPEPEPVAAPEPEAEVVIETPEPETALQPEAEPVPEAPAEEAPAPVEHVSQGEWPPFGETLDETPADAAIGPSRSRTRTSHRGSRSRRSRSTRGAGQPETQEASQEPKAEEKPEQPKPAERKSRRSESKPDKKDQPKAEKKEQPKAEKKDQKPEKKPEAKNEEPRKGQRKTQEPRKVDLSGVLAPYPALQEAHLQQLIADGKKQVLCNTLRKQLGQEKGLALYNEIKRMAWK